MWLLAQQALPAMERKGEWLWSMAAAQCNFCRASSPYTPHVLITCPRVADVWSTVEEFIRAAIPGVSLLEQFLLLGFRA